MYRVRSEGRDCILRIGVRLEEPGGRIVIPALAHAARVRARLELTEPIPGLRDMARARPRFAGDAPLVVVAERGLDRRGGRLLDRAPVENVVSARGALTVD